MLDLLWLDCVCVCVCVGGGGGGGWEVDASQNIPDWKEYLMKRVVGANTLPVDFYMKVAPQSPHTLLPISDQYAIVKIT